jgi:hypothetical protein
MRFVTTTKEELAALREGLDVLSKLDDTESRTVDIYLYGVTSSQTLIDSVKESIAGAIDEDETDIKIAGDVAIAIPLSSDILYYLTGSGLQLKNEEVAYSKGGGNGIDMTSLVFAGFRPKVTTALFHTMAIAREDIWLDKFLQQYGNKGAAVTAPAAHPHTEVTREGVEQHKPEADEVKSSVKPGINRATGERGPENVDPQLIKEFLD